MSTTAEPATPALLSGVSQLNQDLALLGSAQAPFGLSRGQTFSELRLENDDGYGVSPNRSSALPPAEPPLALPPVVAPESRGGAAVPAVPTHPSPGPKRTTLLADGKLSLTQTEFAAQSQDPGPVRFLAEEGRSEGSIGIIRFVAATGSRSSFSADDALSVASSRHPGPSPGRPASSGLREVGAVGAARSPSPSSARRTCR